MGALESYEQTFERLVVPFMAGEGFEWRGWQDFRAARLGTFRRGGLECM